MELMSIEAVRYFTERDNGPAAAAALEAVGFRVGRLLAERWAAIAIATQVFGAVHPAQHPAAAGRGPDRASRHWWFACRPDVRDTPTSKLGGAARAPQRGPLPAAYCSLLAGRPTHTPPHPTPPHTPTPPQVLQGAAAPGRHPGGHQVHLQGLLAGSVQEAGGQPQDQPQGEAAAAACRCGCLRPAGTAVAAALHACQRAQACAELWPAPPLLPNPSQGIYVLQDHSFRWLLRVSPTAPISPTASDADKEEFRRAVHSQLYLPCGMIRGGCGLFCCRVCKRGGGGRFRSCCSSGASGLQRVRLAYLASPRASLPRCGASGELAARLALAPPSPAAHAPAGALTHLGVNCTVEADPKGLPSCEPAPAPCTPPRPARLRWSCAGPASCLARCTVRVAVCRRCASASASASAAAAAAAAALLLIMRSELPPQGR
jgi:hypothetical protein